MSIEDALRSAGDDVIEHLGETVIINNQPFKAIFEDDEFKDETGRLRSTVITVKKSDAALIAKGHAVVARGMHFKVKYVPGTNEPLIEIELHNA